MALVKLLQSVFRKVQSVLLLCVTVSLLFYYTFENEIDILNSYAENEYLPSIKKEIYDQMTLNDESTKSPNRKPLIAADDDVHLDHHQVGFQDVDPQPLDHQIKNGQKSKNSHLNEDLSDPLILKEKNKYFPLLISEPRHDPSLVFVPEEDRPDSLMTSLLTYKEKYPVLLEISLPLHFQQSSKIRAQDAPDDDTNNDDNTKKNIVQATKFEDGGATQSNIRSDVKNVFIKTWKQNDLIKLAKREKNKRWPIDLIDSLDTLYIMDQKDLFQEALDIISETDFRIPPKAVDIVNIADLSTRGVGGLLSAYELSQNQVLLAKAKQMADFILRAFDTPNRLPVLKYSWKSPFNNRFPYKNSTLDDITKMSLELTRLSQLTSEDNYFDAVHRVYTILTNSFNDFSMDYMFPKFVDASGCQILTSKEISSGKHQKNSQIMRSIDENLRFVHCYQSKKVLPVHSNDNNGKGNHPDLITINRSLFDTLIKLYQQLNYHDILNLYEEDIGISSVESHEESPQKEVKSVYKREAAAVITATDSKMEDTLPSGPTSKTILKEFFNTVTRFFIFHPIIPNLNLSLITSVFVKDKYVPTTNELEVELLRTFNVDISSCSLGSTLALNSKISASSPKEMNDQLNMARNLTKSCFQLNKFFQGKMPISLSLDPCLDKFGKEQYCQYNEQDKINNIMNGLYKGDDGKFLHKSGSQNDLTIKISDNKVHSNNNIDDENGGSFTKPKNILILSTNEKYRGVTSILPESINNESKKWTDHPDWPLWINDMGPKQVLNPDLIESIFYMYRITGDAEWREMGHDLFETVLKVLKETNVGAKGLWHISELKGDDSDEPTVPNHWISKTLKYFHLLFGSADKYSLDDYVFSESGHLLKRELPSTA
ncbi:putative mannosidase MNL2 NDAI_0C06450 [Naumovozyma dairenensis CBS 421]|uniref:alpha-1,2-Mannosidase n=1 Tax=Naumovozyma dairenensis (strain ATCC 10597 / BCRC 20456 / CBS 421 / NBRC 0211 / NRRL Y-12639) TaxID=1071378 RepID=G0W943_NAUDC|nr:hypothetical protein NDAI_0C06450 [Naumovozyma dairenensis CBS 421]CCD24304.1 hypothetical protein NDAI_0C06450 [Naumovozyma dairenensis CBS 421]